MAFPSKILQSFCEGCYQLFWNRHSDNNRIKNFISIGKDTFLAVLEEGFALHKKVMRNTLPKDQQKSILQSLDMFVSNEPIEKIIKKNKVSFDFLETMLAPNDDDLPAIYAFKMAVGYLRENARLSKKTKTHKIRA